MCELSSILLILVYVANVNARKPLIILDYRALNLTESVLSMMQIGVLVNSGLPKTLTQFVVTDFNKRQVEFKFDGHIFF